MHEHIIVPLLDRLFDELSGEHELLSFERLEIDLGSISREALGENAVEMDIMNRVADQVREQLKMVQLSPGAIKEPLVDSRARIWMRFLITGRTGWNVTVMDSVFRGQVLESFAGSYEMVRLLRELISDYPDVVKRIIYQHDEEFIIRLLEILTAVGQESFRQFRVELVRVFMWMKRRGHPWASGVDNPDDPRTYVFSWAIRIAARQDSGTSPDKIAARVLQPELLRFIEMQVVPPSVLLDFPLLKPLIEKIVEGAGREEQLDVLEPGPVSRKEEVTAEEGVFVELVGLVLLHPFLHQFFKRLGLVSEGGFVSDKARLKALYLLYFLGTGEMDAPEEMLVVPKLLCDFPAGVPVKRKFRLTNKEVAECTGMLQALIAQWSILGNTSVEGLRGSFLRRNGKVVQRNDNIYIQVEARSFDMLLDHLPWNLGIIRLPWKRELIRVEWR
jgi:hypothetical protein